MMSQNPNTHHRLKTLLPGALAIIALTGCTTGDNNGDNSKHTKAAPISASKSAAPDALQPTKTNSYDPYTEIDGPDFQVGHDASDSSSVYSASFILKTKSGYTVPIDLQCGAPDSLPETSLFAVDLLDATHDIVDPNDQACQDGQLRPDDAVFLRAFITAHLEDF